MLLKLTVPQCKPFKFCDVLGCAKHDLIHQIFRILPLCVFEIVTLGRNPVVRPELIHTL